MSIDNSQTHSERTSVFLVDQNKFFRQGLRVALSQQQGIEVVGEAAIEDGAYEVIRSVLPRVILIGMTHPVVSDIQLIRRIAQELTGTVSIVLTSNIDDDEFIQVVAAGAFAYSSKDVEAVTLANMIRRVADGELLITESLISKPFVLARVLKHFQDLLVKGRAVESTNSPITAREAEVLTHVACGYGNKQIASAFGISEQTIKNHMASILRKLAASDRTHAVVMAMQYGWIATSDRKAQKSWALSGEGVCE